MDLKGGVDVCETYKQNGELVMDVVACFDSFCGKERKKPMRSQQFDTADVQSQ